MTTPDVRKPTSPEIVPLDCPLSRIRIGLICDYVEEGWFSMELVADMLYGHLSAGVTDGVDVARLRPAMRRRFSHTPLLDSKISLNVDRLVNRFWDYPRWLAKERDRFDLFHLVDHSYSQLVHSLPAERTVVTCHDLDTFRCLLEPKQEPRPPWFRFMARQILDGFRKAAYVIAVSEATRAQLLNYGLVEPTKVRVIHNGVNPVYSPVPQALADETAARLMPRDHSSDIWLLNVSSNAPRKRIDLLLQVLAAVRQVLPGVRLARVGGPLSPEHQALARDLNLEEALVIAPYLTSDELAAVYRRADLLVHPAEAEGFGLPIVEAMACGCPVVATDLPVLREVGGKAVLFRPLGDIRAWMESITQLLEDRTGERSAWRSQRQSGLEQSKRFCWVTTAREVTQVYSEVMGRSGLVGSQR